MKNQLSLLLTPLLVLMAGLLSGTMIPIEQSEDFESRWIQSLVEVNGEYEDDPFYRAAVQLMPKVIRARQHESTYQLTGHKLKEIDIRNHFLRQDTGMLSHATRVMIHPFSGWQSVDPIKSFVSVVDANALEADFEHLSIGYDLMMRQSREEGRMQQEEVPARFAVLSIFAKDMLDQEFFTDFLLVETVENEYVFRGMSVPRPGPDQGIAVSPASVSPEALEGVVIPDGGQLVGSVEELESIRDSAQQSRIRERDAIVHRAQGGWAIARWMPLFGLSVIALGAWAWWVRSRRRRVA